MPPRAILLDALGTLVALEPPAPALTTLLRERHGIDVQERDAARALHVEMGHYREQCVRAGDAASLAALRLECAEILAAALGDAALGVPAAALLKTLLASLRFSPFREVPDALACWRAAGIRLVVASNWDVSLHDVLDATGLRPLLDGVVTSAEVGASKPSARLFDAALAVAGVRPRQALHVGDSLTEDVEGARGAGIEAVWLRRDPARGPAPDGVPVISSLDQLAVVA